MITNLQVKNFKSLKDVSLTFGRRNVLIGPNMAGKSNIISVFRFLSHMVVPSPGTVGLLNAIAREGGFASLAWRGGESNLISISLDGELGGLPLEGGKKRKWHYTLEIAGEQTRDWITVHDETLRVSGPEGENTLIRRDAGSGRRVLMSPTRGVITETSENNRSALEYEIPDWEGNQFRQLFASFHFCKLVPQMMKQINAVAAPASLDETGSNLSSWLMLLQTRHAESFERITRVIKDVLPDVANLFTWPTAQSTVFVASTERFLRTAVPVWQMSDGELCFVAFLSLILAPLDHGAALFCVEEPENHLHPKLIEALAAIHDQRRRELGEDACQVLATTHSPLLVDRCQTEDVIVIEKREGATICTRPSDKPHLRELLTREEIGLGDLLYSGALSGERG